MFVLFLRRYSNIGKALYSCGGIGERSIGAIINGFFLSIQGSISDGK
jgi:hypothetical protein